MDVHRMRTFALGAFSTSVHQMSPAPCASHMDVGGRGGGSRAAAA